MVAGPEQAWQVVVGDLERRLRAGGLTAQARKLSSLGAVAPAPRPAQPASLAVLSHLDRALLAAGRNVGGELVAAVGVLDGQAPWTQTASYLERPPHPGFLDEYAHATLAGPPDRSGSSPGSGRSDAAVGLLLLGPDAFYPAHRHPADEVYLPLASALWLDEEAGTYQTRAAGELRHHRPEQAHGMLTRGEPLLAIYLWTGEVVTPASF